MIKRTFLHKATCLIAAIWAIFVLVGACAAQSVEELKKENETLKEKIRLVEENNALKAKLEALLKNTPNPERASDPSGVRPNDKQAAVQVEGFEEETATPVAGAKQLFATGNGKVIKSVCAQQALDPESSSIYEKTVCDVARQLVFDAKLNPDDGVVFDVGGFTESMAILIAGKLAELPPAESKLSADVRDFILANENQRNDKQIGGDSKSAGTTSLAVKGGIPDFLSWAVENGAAVGSRSGNTLTFRINPAGLIDNLDTAPVPFANSTDFGSFFRSEKDFAGAFRNLSLGFSFDITRGTDPPVFIGSKQQLSAVSVRYNFINQKDPRNPRYRDDWEQFSKNSLKPFTKFAYDLHARLVNTNSTPTTYKNADLEKWRQETKLKLNAVSIDSNSREIELVEQIRQVLVAQLNVLPVAKLTQDSVVVQAVNENAENLISYSAKKKELQEKIAKGAVVTLEYTNYREVSAPDVSNIRLIAEKGLGSEWSIAANASISFLNKKPSGANVSRIRDFDFSLQIERSLRDLGFGKPILSFSGLYQRLPKDVIGPDGMKMMNTAGDIASGQLKLTIPINGTGIKLPISVTFANRTELVKESDVRGNFGFTFDLDPLLSRMRLFRP